MSKYKVGDYFVQSEYPFSLTTPLVDSTVYEVTFIIKTPHRTYYEGKEVQENCNDPTDPCSADGQTYNCFEHPEMLPLKDFDSKSHKFKVGDRVLCERGMRQKILTTVTGLRAKVYDVNPNGEIKHCWVYRLADVDENDFDFNEYELEP